MTPTDWKTCRIGSCQRHHECMYRPCRNAYATLTPQAPSAPEGLLIELDEAMALNEQSMADCQAEYAREKYRKANAAIEQAIGVLRAQAGSADG